MNDEQLVSGQRRGTFLRITLQRSEQIAQKRPAPFLVPEREELLGQDDFDGLDDGGDSIVWDEFSPEKR